MRDTKVLKLLANFPPEDWKRLRDFLASPIFNKDQNVLRLFGYLADAFPRIPTSDQVLVHLFPEEKDREEARLTRLKTKLVALVREYVDFQARFREDDHLMHALARCAVWAELGETGFHRQEIDAIQAELAGGDNLDSYRELWRYHLGRHLAAHGPHHARKAMFAQLEAAYFSLDTFQKVQKLRHLCILANLSRFSGETPPAWLQAAFADADSMLVRDAPLTRLYHACLQAQLLAGSPAKLADFRHLLDLLEPQLSREEALELYQFVINDHIRKFNQRQNDPEALLALQALYESLLDKEILLEKGGISAWNYKNIVSIMLRGADLAWLDAFMAKYAPLIRFDEAGNAAQFCRGMVAFYRKDFRETARCMEGVLTSFRNVFWGLEARCLLMQAYFEQGDAAGLEATYNSIRMYRDRKAKPEISEAYSEGYANFYKLLYKLHLILSGDMDKRAGKLARLRTRVQELRPLPNQAWLLAKIEGSL